MTDAECTSHTLKPSRRFGMERAIYCVIWLLIMLLPVCMQCYEMASGRRVAMNWHAVWFTWRHILPFLALFLLNDLVLLPRLFLRNRRKLYVVALIAAIAACLWALPLPSPPPADAVVDPHRPPHSHHVRAIITVNFIIAMVTVMSNIAFKLYFKWVDDTKRLSELKAAQVNSELQALKYQVNPHFLMNTLNNIQALIDIDPDRATDIIQRLSGMMRHMLYESADMAVPLYQEVDFINNFIELMRVRYPDSVVITTRWPEGRDAVKVPALLFITFIENAFKYGVSYERESYVSVSIEVDERNVSFYCENLINTRPHNGTSGGLGLRNVSKRLNLIYGDDYTLSTDEVAGRYIVKMTIPHLNEHQP